MAKTRHYKKIEKNIASSFMSALKAGFSKIGHFFVSFFKICDSRLTIMIVPHSQSKVVNFQTNVFALCFGILLIIGIISSFVYFNRQAAGSSAEISRLINENRQTLASLDELRDENNNLLQTAKRFQSSLSQSLSLLGINSSSSVSKASMGDSDLSSLFDTQSQVSGSTKEAADIRQLNSYLENAVQPIEQIGKMLESQGSLFTDIPNIWPIKFGIGHISMQFGQNVHPITGQWYIHKGLDFSTWRSGDPIVATANGQVVTVGYDFSFGNYVIIKHKHGIYTRYCHMQTTRVKKGEFVSQRQVIGTIGNTGITTGPHLHYEIHIGSDVVDPAKYVNVKLSK
ncbi:MAG: M23 family metallopeptidase [Spirochaetia bacterium]|uniref:M23 family metallopeptidase n=1 Tax=Treponema berlinense TaxID=225004 RepID=UPI0026F1F406|nr:M23 family metallopeptidase [Treponema berlinense]MDD5789484.1 M23 family metallopeptidase [Spirochaetia bacterium]